jgi:hypothetical protein
MLVACDKIPILDKVIDGLYVGDVVAANNLAILKEKDINILISMVPISNHFENIEYHSFLINDNRNENISIYFEEINTIIFSNYAFGNSHFSHFSQSSLIEKNGKSENFQKCASNKHKNILVHCENGVSRSVTVILAYLLKNNYTLKEALTQIKTNRTSTFTRPNSGFARQLLKYEKEIFGINSISLLEILG